LRSNSLTRSGFLSNLNSKLEYQNDALLIFSKRNTHGNGTDFGPGPEKCIGFHDKRVSLRPCCPASYVGSIWYGR